MLIFSQKGIIHPLLLLSFLALLIFGAIFYLAPFKNDLLSRIYPKSPSMAAGSFLDSFDGSPNIVAPFKNDPGSSNWDIAIQSRNSDTWQNLEPMQAHHGADCAPPFDTSGNLVTHAQAGLYEQAVFKCKDHLMTAINSSSYGVIYLTPNQIADFSEGEVVIKVDVTTIRTSMRDWWDIWITPYDENLQLPFETGDVDLNGVPKRAVHISNDGNANGSGTGFHPTIYKNFEPTNDFRGFTDDFNWWTGYETFMKTSPQKRTTFELRLSKNHLKFGIPVGQTDQDGKPINNGQAFWWIDKDITPLDWDKGIIQFGHHSYTPQKDCTFISGNYTSCYPNTWHWDNISISNSTSFKIIKADRRMVTDSTVVNFTEPAPLNSHLRFSGIGTIDISFDNGATWQRAPKQQSSTLALGTYHPEHLTSYFVPIPEGKSNVKFRFSKDDWYEGPYQAKDFTIWSTSSDPAPSPSASITPIKSGDTDNDGDIDIFDYNLLLTDFGKTNDSLTTADLDNDNDVDIFDYNILLTNFGK